MIIHSVTQGDTIFKIARKYSVQPTKIIEDNGLEGDRLSIGQELLILTPTRTVTVRGGDTLASLARRFGVRRSSLLSNNPALSGDPRLRPGHILSVKFDTPQGGASSAVGIYSRTAGERKLKQTLPYLTYVIFESYEITANDCKRIYDTSSAHLLCKRNGKITLLDFYDSTDGEFLFSDSTYPIIDKMIEAAQDGGYSGISIRASSASKKNPQLMAAFLMEARKRLIGCDLILFTNGSLSGCDGAELSDGAIFNPWENDKFYSESGAENLMEYSEKRPAEKTFVKLPTMASFGEGEMKISDAYRLAERSGAELYKRDDMLTYFDYKRYIRGTGKDIRVYIPSPSMIKAKLDNVRELGFMGIAFDIESVPVWLLSMFNTYFSRADYSLLFGEEV